MPDADAEDLVARLSGGLSPADRAAFRKAAEAALATSPECSGEGATHRVITKIWRSYFRPVGDTNGSGWYVKRERPEGASSLPKASAGTAPPVVARAASGSWGNGNSKFVTVTNLRSRVGEPQVRRRAF
jgi:anti-sigma factor RsiW